ncbi:hypothetical protein OHU45_25890 [Streptomyces tubercidicus]|uniref:hypothetical protein n=1 Tax=Streptomyces tubercidicus TaxID=47759 RepID=UPI0032555B29
MNHPVGTEIDATAQWLEGRGASGAAILLRRVARQRDEARAELKAQRTHAHPAPEQTTDPGQRATTNAQPIAPLDTAAHAMLRTDMARLQALAERAGWVADPGQRRLWRWREGWWELSYRKKNAKDGYHDSGWHLWGPPASYFGEWIAAHKADAMTEADKLITKHLAAAGEGKR